jgi:hypothetical protein
VDDSAAHPFGDGSGDVCGFADDSRHADASFHRCDY